MRRTDKKKTFGQQSSKVTQLADTLSQAISMKKFREGDSLPSINQLSAEYGVSRDTVFKAFLDLRERGLIDSTPGKGYYVTSQVTNVLLLLDQYTPFKEALYNSFVKHLPINYKVDLLFHQYNERLFNTIIRESVGKYNKYIVMNFDNEKFSMVLNKIHPTKLISAFCPGFSNSSLCEQPVIVATAAIANKIFFIIVFFNSLILLYLFMFNLTQQAEPLHPHRPNHQHLHQYHHLRHPD